MDTFENEQPPLKRRLLEIGMMAAAYYVAGRVALLLAIPPGYATAVWPAAGLALAGMLITRNRVWPGILIGHFFVNVFTGYDPDNAQTMAYSLSLALVIAFGSPLQAWLGASLARKFVGYPTRLDQERQVLLLLLLGGPVGCLLAPTLGANALILFGAIEWSDYAFNWFTWWVGDTIGVMLVAPAAIIIAAGRYEVPLRRQLSVTIPLIAMLALVIVFFVVSRNVIMGQIGTEYRWLAWAVLIVGVLFTSLMSAFLMVVTGRAAMVEREVALRTHELKLANRELEAFSYSVAHDLRSPLTEVLGYGEILSDLLEYQLDDKSRRYLEGVVSGANRMASLIDDLMKLSKIKSVPLHPESVDLSTMAEGIVTELRAREPARRIEVEITPGLVAVCDRGLMKIALENLLGNAWKFTARRNDARIAFSVVFHEDHPAFCVSDNGAGFDMQSAMRLFTPFNRLHNPNEFDGTGVGLATVQRIITRHEGRISAVAAKGEGATFFFTIGNQPTVRTASGMHQRKPPSGLVLK